MRFIERWCSAKIVLDFPVTLRGGEGGGSKVNVTMTLIFPKVVWKCPLTVDANRYVQCTYTLNEHALNKIVRTHTLLRVLIARLERLGGV